MINKHTQTINNFVLQWPVCPLIAPEYLIRFENSASRDVLGFNFNLGIFEEFCFKSGVFFFFFFFGGGGGGADFMTLFTPPHHHKSRAPPALSLRGHYALINDKTN